MGKWIKLIRFDNNLNTPFECLTENTSPFERDEYFEIVRPDNLQERRFRQLVNGKWMQTEALATRIANAQIGITVLGSGASTNGALPVAMWELYIRKKRDFIVGKLNTTGMYVRFNENIEKYGDQDRYIDGLLQDDVLNNYPAAVVVGVIHDGSGFGNVYFYEWSNWGQYEYPDRLNDYNQQKHNELIHIFTLENVPEIVMCPSVRNNVEIYKYRSTTQTISMRKSIDTSIPQLAKIYRGRMLGEDTFLHEEIRILHQHKQRIKCWNQCIFPLAYKGQDTNVRLIGNVPQLVALAQFGSTQSNSLRVCVNGLNENAIYGVNMSTKVATYAGFIEHNENRNRPNDKDMVVYLTYNKNIKAARKNIAIA